MNDQTPQSSLGARQIAGITLFIGIILGIAWLGVQVVGYLPQAVNSLATIAETVHHQDSLDLEPVSTPQVSNTGEDVTLSWETYPTGAFIYEFSYECTDGVALSIITDAETTPLACDEVFEIAEPPLQVTITSDENRFTDVTYHIAARRVDAETTTVTSDGLVTIVNASIVPDSLVITPTDDNVTEDETDTGTPDILGTTTDSTGADDNTDTSAGTSVGSTGGIRYEEVVTYSQPVSDPNGYTDLAVRYLGVGQLEAGVFEPSATIDANSTGSLRVEVRNRGTRTSDAWRYVAELPNGDTYTSPEQAPLLPNERATITLGFEVSDTDKRATFSVEVETDRDLDRSNNDFSWSVAIVD